MKHCLALMLAGLCLQSAAATAADDGTIVFEGYDPLWESNTTIVKRDGTYYMDGGKMEELRHPNMPSDGLSLTLTSRVGRPNMYYVVLPRMLEIYINCEFGACTFRRSITGSCCESPGQN